MDASRLRSYPDSIRHAAAGCWPSSSSSSPPAQQRQGPRPSAFATLGAQHMNVVCMACASLFSRLHRVRIYMRRVDTCPALGISTALSGPKGSSAVLPTVSELSSHTRGAMHSSRETRFGRACLFVSFVRTANLYYTTTAVQEQEQSRMVSIYKFASSRPDGGTSLVDDSLMCSGLMCTVFILSLRHFYLNTIKIGCSLLPLLVHLIKHNLEVRTTVFYLC